MHIKRQHASRTRMGNKHFSISENWTLIKNSKYSVVVRCNVCGSSVTTTIKSSWDHDTDSRTLEDALNYAARDCGKRLVKAARVCAGAGAGKDEE